MLFCFCFLLHENSIKYKTGKTVVCVFVECMTRGGPDPAGGCDLGYDPAGVYRWNKIE